MNKQILFFVSCDYSFLVLNVKTVDKSALHDSADHDLHDSAEHAILGPSLHNTTNHTIQEPTVQNTIPRIAQ
jgi:hypothetical protein